MTFKYWILSGLTIFAVVGVIACGKSTNSNSTAGVALVPNGTSAGCPAGSTLIYTYGSPMCQGPNGITTPLFQNTMGGYQYSTDNYCYRNLSVSNSSVFRAFLKEAMGVCDQAQSTGGMADCSSWTSGYVKVDVVTTGSQLNISFYTYPYMNSYYNYSYSLPSLSQFFLGVMGFPVYTQNYSAMRNPLVLGMSLFPINNTLGFEGRSMGDTYTVANRSLIQLQVQQGKAGDASFNYVISYAPTSSGVSTPFLSGSMINKSNYGSYGCY
jgi:hypothetical protein